METKTPLMKSPKHLELATEYPAFDELQDTQETIAFLKTKMEEAYSPNPLRLALIAAFQPGFAFPMRPIEYITIKIKT